MSIIRNHDLMTEGPGQPSRNAAGVSDLLGIGIILIMETTAVRMKAGGSVQAKQRDLLWSSDEAIPRHSECLTPLEASRPI